MKKNVKPGKTEKTPRTAFAKKRINRTQGKQERKEKNPKKTKEEAQEYSDSLGNGCSAAEKDTWQQYVEGKWSLLTDSIKSCWDEKDGNLLVQKGPRQFDQEDPIILSLGKGPTIYAGRTR